MKIAIVGYGKMGKMIEEVCKNKNIQISFIIDQNNLMDLKNINPTNTDVAIEFSTSNSVVNNILTLLEQNVPTICGTTGWQSNLNEIQSKVENLNGSFLYGSNFSIGVNLMFKMNNLLAKWMNNFEEYDVCIEERHHNMKKDAPSGTAISLANGILNELDRKSQIAKNEIVNPSDLSIGYTRIGSEIGRHSVIYNSPIDQITLIHEAYTRKGFAQGAVFAADWLKNKKGFYTVEDIYKEL